MERVTYNTRLDPELLKEFKILAIRLGMRQSQLMEQALLGIIEKYSSQMDQGISETRGKYSLKKISTKKAK